MEQAGNVGLGSLFPLSICGVGASFAFRKRKKPRLWRPFLTEPQLQNLIANLEISCSDLLV
jgi:hypothetical protein